MIPSLTWVYTHNFSHTEARERHKSLKVFLTAMCEGNLGNQILPDPSWNQITENRSCWYCPNMYKAIQKDQPKKYEL